MNASDEMPRDSMNDESMPGGVFIYSMMPLPAKVLLWLVCGILLMVIILLVMSALGILPAWINMKFNLVQISVW